MRRPLKREPFAVALSSGRAWGGLSVVPRDCEYGRKTMKRQDVIRVCVAVLLLAWGSNAWAQSKEFVVAAWGNPYEATWRKSLVPEFEKRYGVKVVWAQGFSTQTLAKLRAQKDSPQVDLAMMDDGPHFQAVALGLVERVDRAKLSNAKDLHDIAFEPDGYGIAFGLDAIGLHYNTKAFAENKWAPPTSWLDLYRPEFKGKVSVHNIANIGGLFLLLMMNRIAGGSDANVDAGFAKLRELVPQVVTFDKFGETPTLIQQGLAVIGTWGPTRVYNLAATGVPVEFVYPKEGAGGYKEVATIIKGRPNSDLAHKFIDMMLSKEEQEHNAKELGMGPVNRRATLDPDTARKVVTVDMINKLVIPNWPVVNANRPAWTERWNKEIERR